MSVTDTAAPVVHPVVVMERHPNVAAVEGHPVPIASTVAIWRLMGKGVCVWCVVCGVWVGGVGWGGGWVGVGWGGNT